METPLNCSEKCAEMSQLYVLRPQLNEVFKNTEKPQLNEVYKNTETTQKFK